MPSPETALFAAARDRATAAQQSVPDCEAAVSRRLAVTAHRAGDHGVEILPRQVKVDDIPVAADQDVGRNLRDAVSLRIILRCQSPLTRLGQRTLCSIRNMLDVGQEVFELGRSF